MSNQLSAPLDGVVLTLIAGTRPEASQANGIHPVIMLGQVDNRTSLPAWDNLRIASLSPNHLDLRFICVVMWVPDDDLDRVWVYSPNSSEGDIRSLVQHRIHHEFCSCKQEKGIDSEICFSYATRIGA